MDGLEGKEIRKAFKNDDLTGALSKVVMLFGELLALK
jgi:hypothetical protein